MTFAVRSSARFARWLLLSAAVAPMGCDEEPDGDEQGVAPPPIASSKPGVCASGGGKVEDSKSAAYFPGVSGDYCVDPNGETRAYGAEAPNPLDEVCTQQFDGECEVYKSYGLDRVVTLRYVDGKGSPGAISVTLSRFDDEEGAYGFFTKRVVADGDPKQSAPAVLEAGGAGALGSGIAYAWRGPYVAELSYTNELESPDKIRESAKRVLPPLAKAIGEKLPGDKALPEAAQKVPRDHRIDQGLTYTNTDVLDVSGVGQGAVGYYIDGVKRWRVFAVVRPDEDSAKDVMKTFKKLDGAKSLKDAAPFGVLRVPRQLDEALPVIEWLIARKGNTVFGVGDESFVLSPDQPASEREKVLLSEAEKVERLETLVQGAAAEKE